MASILAKLMRLARLLTIKPDLDFVQLKKPLVCQAAFLWTEVYLLSQRGTLKRTIIKYAET
jgi:hypothetical protein